MSETDFKKFRQDYPKWHRLQVETDDIDPVYPVLKATADALGLDAEQRAWLVICHVIWYHPGSTFAGFEKLPSISDMPTHGLDLWELGLLEIPTGTERRGHRPKQPLIDHLLGLPKSMPDGVWSWAEGSAVGDTPEARWTALIDALLKIQGNGRWAAYKTAEMLQKVCGLDIQAPDAGHKFSSGPRKGLRLLDPDTPEDNSRDSIEYLDFVTETWAEILQEPDIAQVETSLCDFNSLVGGRYYLGHDIDSMLAAWNHPTVGQYVPEAAWAARRETFSEEFLGEVGNWAGVRRELKNGYKLGSVLDWR